MSGDAAERLRVWDEIKAAAVEIIRAGGNPGEILVWSRGKTLGERRYRL